MFENEIKILNELSKYRIEIGVISDDASRNDKSISAGITNAELMFIHENGSPIKNIPERPVLQMTIDWVNSSGLFESTMTKIVNNILFNNWSKEDSIKELELLCNKMQNYARDIIYLNDGRLKPNSPNVAAKKKGNHPLFDTGQLARSITCRLSK